MFRPKGKDEDVTPEFGREVVVEDEVVNGLGNVSHGGIEL